jgi:hypothetical protein
MPRGQFLIQLLVVTACAWLVAGCARAVASRAPILSATENFWGGDFHSDEFVRTVNGLRALGKEGALEALDHYSSYVLDRQRSMDIALVCKTLFVKPRGWETVEMLRDRPDLLRLLPSYPVVVWQGVPLLLTKNVGYGAGMRSGKSYIEECRRYEMIGADLPQYDKNQAAEASRSLTASALFASLFKSSEDRIEMSRYLAGQAEPSVPRQQNLEGRYAQESFAYDAGSAGDNLAIAGLVDEMPAGSFVTIIVHGIPEQADLHTDFAIQKGGIRIVSDMPGGGEITLERQSPPDLDIRMDVPSPWIGVDGVRICLPLQNGGLVLEIHKSADYQGGKARMWITPAASRN